MKHLFTLTLSVVCCSIMQLSATQAINATRIQELLQQTDNSPIMMDISDNCIVNLKWQERKSAFSRKEGIRIFAGYNGSSLSGIISISNDIVSGWVSDGHNSYIIDTDSAGNLSYTIQEGSHNNCYYCQTAYDKHNNVAEPAMTIQASGDSQWTEQRDETLVYNSGILYIYRLALPVSYYNYSTTFSNDISQVKAYWARTQAGLNELYVREIGVYFDLVDDDRLIITDPTYGYPTSTSSWRIVEESTIYVNKLIGEANYDIGIVLAKCTEVGGLAGIAAAYSKSLKHHCMTAAASTEIIGHELGHMFASSHTFTTGGTGTYYTEPGTGQSIMSYGFPRNFFSFPSVYFIRRCLNRLPYLSYPERTDTLCLEKLQGMNYDNFVAGIDTHNNPPMIDVTKLKKTYRIPKGTYFQFNIDATDPDGDDLNYMAHQANLYLESGGTFACRRSQSDPTICFQPTYSYSWIQQKFLIDDYTDIDPEKTGDYYFWLAVTDGKTITDDEDFLQNPHAMGYDAFETKLEVVDGTPFKITSTIPNRSTCGERISLKWSVDKNIFDENSRVRILLSDDFGKTFKYVLKESAPNSGSCEVILPHITIGAVKIEDDVNKTARGGVIKIEEIDGVAYALSATSPFYEYNDVQSMTGGFLLYASSIIFQNTPDRYVTVGSDDEVPDVANVTATYNGKALDVTFTESREGNVISRVWEAQTSLGARSAFEQIICIGNTTSGITDIETDRNTAKIYAVSGTMYIDGIAGMSIQIYDTTGRRLFNKNNSAETESITLQPGIYIVIINGKAYKSKI